MKRLEHVVVAVFSLLAILFLVQAINALFVANQWELLDASGWASWVQAIGSIAAIVYAVKIANGDRDFQRAEKMVFAVLQGQSIKHQLDEFLYMARYHGEEVTSERVFNANLSSHLLDWFSKQPMWTIEDISLLAALPGEAAVNFAKGQAAIRAAIAEMHYARDGDPPRSDGEDVAYNQTRRAKKSAALYWEGLDLLQAARNKIPETLPAARNRWW